ncbi:hypothetical protein [Umboniibacter marinipuniceus]|uniref:Uncharacterized protein n=1 Tax=Umboniibacter marinipuniceus TaxID=569599 RepID=A0A3M0ADS3_9GAMM|nr:hypothetical protein [Umboniibacter marinipuniceus]RMA82686.1 hypothetical protein DFR27_0639 [Umboniibacter marinipuniceus]
MHIKELARIVTGILVLTGLASCTVFGPTGRDLQSQCEAQLSGFIEIYECTYRLVAEKRPDILNDYRGQLYLLRGALLAEEVEKNQRTDLSAKFAWQSLYVELRRYNEQQALAQVQAIQALVDANPQNGKRINCISSEIGSEIHIQCQ